MKFSIIRSTIRSFLLMVLLLLLFGCDVQITRKGYKVEDLVDISGSDCYAAIKNNMDISSVDVEMLGEIKASDSGFSTTCDEDYVLDIFLSDACALGADVINIIEEEHPDHFWSSCYRAKAEFLRINDRQYAGSVQSDPEYTPELITERSNAARAKTDEMMDRAIVGGIIGGVVGGIIVSQ